MEKEGNPVIFLPSITNGNALRNLFLSIGGKFVKINARKINSQKINSLKLTWILGHVPDMYFRDQILKNDGVTKVKKEVINKYVSLM